MNRACHRVLRMACRAVLIAIATVALPHSRLHAENLADRSQRFLLGESGTIRGWSMSGLTQAPSGVAKESGQAAQQIAPPRSAVLFADRSGSLDLGLLFKPRNAGSDTLVAEGHLSVPRDVQGWLLLKVAGGLVVAVDGKTALRRDAPTAHARGWEAISLHLTAGTHSIRLNCRFQREPWILSARFIDQSGHAPVGSEWWLRAAQTKNQNEPFDVTVELNSTPPAGLGIRIDAPIGTLLTQPEHVAIVLKSGDGKYAKTFAVGDWPRADTPTTPLYAHLGTIDELLEILPDADNSLSIDVTGGKAHVTRVVHLPRVALLAWKKLTGELSSLVPEQGAGLDIPRASLLSAGRDLAAVISENRSTPEIEKVAGRAERLAEHFANRRQPWSVPGIHDLAWRASADGSLQRFALQVPASIQDGKPRPLVVVLHGYNGTGKRILEAFLDTPADATGAKVDGYVLAPAAHGNTFFRGPGERDVLEILDWAVQALGVDSTRVTITGASMGGTGTAEIAFHYPDRFAALAPLCGYHSYFVRRDIGGQPLRGWERRLMHRFSPASSAEAGRYLPMFLAQGLKDKPLENGKVLTERYKKLGFSLTEDWPDLGHAVWKRTWAHASLFPWLTQRSLVDDPPKTSLSITSLRHAKSHWLSLTELDSQSELSQINAEFANTNELVVSTKGVRAFTVGPTKRVDPNQPFHARIDDSPLSMPPHSVLQFHLEGSTWTVGPPARTPLHKTVHAEGPWPDLWNERLVFVYGSLNPETIGTNLNVASAMAAPQGGADYQYPVVSDREYQSAIRDDYVPILVGTAADNALLSKWARQLPVTIEGQSLVLGKQKYTGDRLGAIYVYPNPDQPTRIIGVVTAPSPEGLWQSTSLPMLLPDFVVFDARVAPASGQPILGRQGRVLAAGFFNADWSLPAKLSDPLDER